MTLSVRARAGGAPFVGVLAFLSAAYVASGVFVGKRDGRGAGGGLLEAHPHYQQWRQAAGLVSDGISYARARGDGRGRAPQRRGGRGGGREGTTSEALVPSPRKEKRSKQGKDRAAPTEPAGKRSGKKESKSDGRRKKESRRGGPRDGEAAPADAGDAAFAGGAVEEQRVLDERLHESQAKVRVVGING